MAMGDADFRCSEDSSHWISRALVTGVLSIAVDLPRPEERAKGSVKERFYYVGT